MDGDGDGGVPTTEVNSERRVSLLMAAHSSGSGLRHGRGCGRGRGRGFTSSSSSSSSLASYRVSTAQSLRYDDGDIEEKGSDSGGRDGDDGDRDASPAKFPEQQPRYDAQRSVARSMAALNHHARPMVCGGRIRGGRGWQGRDANPAADPSSGDAPETR